MGRKIGTFQTRLIIHTTKEKKKKKNKKNTRHTTEKIKITTHYKKLNTYIVGISFITQSR